MKALKAQGISRDTLPYKAPFQPYVSYISFWITAVVTFFKGMSGPLNPHKHGLMLNLLLHYYKGFDSFTPVFNHKTFITNYIGAPIFFFHLVGLEDLPQDTRNPLRRGWSDYREEKLWPGWGRSRCTRRSTPEVVLEEDLGWSLVVLFCFHYRGWIENVGWRSWTRYRCFAFSILCSFYDVKKNVPLHLRSLVLIFGWWLAFLVLACKIQCNRPYEKFSLIFQIRRKCTIQKVAKRHKKQQEVIGCDGTQ